MRKLLNEAGLWLVGIPVLLWTVLPIYHMLLFALSTSGLPSMKIARSL